MKLFDIVMPLENYRIAYIIKRPTPYSYFSDKYRKQYFKLITDRLQKYNEYQECVLLIVFDIKI